MSNGFPGGRINSIAQTADGYLWIGTSKGLVRFDGFSFISVGQSNRLTAPISQALAVVSGVDGSLWVWDQNMNVQRYLHAEFSEVASLTGDERGAVAAIAPSTEGDVLVSTQGPRVFRYRDGHSEALTRKDNLGIPSPQTIAQTSDGKVWMATYEAGLFYWESGRVTSVKAGIPDSKINCMLPVENGGLWIGTDKGVVLWNGREVSSQISSSSLHGARVISLLRDRDSNLWIGTSNGLYRFNAEGLKLTEDSQHGLEKTVTAIFEDREGNLWVGGGEGIERLRDGLFTTYSIQEGLPAESTGPIYADQADRAWVAPSRGGLYRIEDGATTPILPEQLGRDVIYSITGFGDDLWIGRREGGLTHLVNTAGTASGVHALKTYTHLQGLAQNSVASVFRSSDGAIWAGTLSGGVSRLRNEKFTTITAADGLGSNTISSIQEDRDGAMWFGTSDGLTRFTDGRFTTYRAHDGLPSDEVVTLLCDSSGVLWAGTSQGLAYFSRGRLTPVVDTHAALHEAIFGLADDGKGSLWITSSNHVFRVNRSALLKSSVDLKDYREFSEEDGLRGTEGVRRDRSVVADTHGRIWLSASHGFSMVYPTRLENTAAPALPHVESVTSDGKQVPLEGSTLIGPAPQRITIAYEAVSLAMPYRVQYRYRLRGFDHTWSDPTEARQVVYTNLEPGAYQFALMTLKGNGTWSGSENALSFVIQPTVWQTWWMKLACSISAAGFLWLFYLYRLRLATTRIHERLDARLEERERIARELHDTLLQGFQGLMLRLQAVLNKIPAQETTHKLLEQVLDRADEVLLEGREGVKDLRRIHMTGDDVSEMVRRCGEEMIQGSSTQFAVAMIGSPRALDPVVLNEVLQIAKEALFNCVQHAQASKIAAEVTYSNGAFSLSILDDGIGIDEALVQNGRTGHWGLTGMRERTKKIGGRFSIWTTPGKGTEVSLTIRSKLAYSRRPQSKLFSRSSGD